MKAFAKDALDLYQQPYGPKRPLVCLDESNKQLTIERELFAFASFGVSANSQLRRPNANGRITFSAAALLMPKSPLSPYVVSLGYWLSV